MNHETIKEKLQAFRDRELAKEENGEIERHLPFCEECRGILKRWETIRGAFMRAASAGPSEIFVQEVMVRLGRLDEPAPSVRRWAFLDWLFPALGYSFAIVLMAIAITHREPLVNTESVLLADVPQNSHWAFSPEPAGVNTVLEQE